MLEEDGKLCYGVYAGVVSSSKDIRTFVEQADLVIMLGTKMTDVNCGIFTADIDQEKILIAKNGYAGSYTECVNDNLDFYRFITGFAQFINPKPVRHNNLKIPPFQIPQTNSVMDQYLRIIEEHITKEHVIVADTGDSCYGSLAMRMKSDNSYFAPLFYNTMGYAVPASVGIQLAMPDKRPVVLVGDGAFQMTGMELSTSLRLGLNPIIIIFNNSGYGMQRVFQDGNFNTLTPWNYTSITKLIGGGIAQKVETVQNFQNTLQNAMQTKDSLFVIEALVPKGDISTGLKTFTDAAKREKTGICPFLENPDHVCSVSSSCGFCRASIWQE